MTGVEATSPEVTVAYLSPVPSYHAMCAVPAASNAIEGVEIVFEVPRIFAADQQWDP